MPPRSATAAADTAHPLIDRFKSFVNAAAFPCVGAKSALGRGRMRFVVARDLGSAWNDLAIWDALAAKPELTADLEKKLSDAISAYKSQFVATSAAKKK